ncbi:MAG: TolB family protein [Isosphaerales bacterium]
MAAHLGRLTAPLRFALGLGLLAFGLTAAGCDAVQEDRTIEFSADAGSVGFQHGDQGVFVADKDGGGLKKVFQPGADVLATSTPLWSPKGRRLVFTTARAADGDPAASTQAQAQVRGLLRGGADPDPAGDLFFGVPIVYTCWLRDEAAGEPPVKLFEAKCDHAGYVAANLAVRWHPQGDRILHVDAVSSGRHALFAYDLKTKASRRIFPHDASALIFDWSPDGKHLACVLSSTGTGSDRDGLWIGQPDGDPSAWWHVPGSNELAEADLGSLLEQLRATRPAWTADGASFAFVTHRARASQSDPGESRLWIGTLAGRRIEQVARETARLQDLHWSPRGDKLGLVRSATEPTPFLAAAPAPAPAVRAMPAVASNPPSTLHVWSRGGGLSGPLNTRLVRRFAGWCAAGDHLAYVVPDDVLGAENPLWSFLLIPDPLSRDAVVITAGDGSAEGKRGGKPAFSGLRVTFPHWSPSSNEEVLSLWCTFSPSHRSVLSRFLGGGLRSGDPAALLDARTRSLSWMAVSPLEEAQIGHYLQLKGEYLAASQRYERAEAAPPTNPGAKVASTPEPELKNPTEWLSRLFSPRGIAVFQFHCLTKLGRHEEAKAKLDQFRRSYPPHLPTGPPPSGATTSDGSGFPFDQPWFRDAMRPGGLCARLLEDLYIAEVLLSLDASEDARAYFRAVVDSRSGESDAARLSAAVVLSQILLLEGKHDLYAELATESLAPALLKLRRSLPATQPSSDPLDLSRHLSDFVGGLALLPLASKTFLSGLSDTRLKSTAERWETLRGEANDDLGRLAADLVLEATYRQLGQEPKRRQAAERLEHNPARTAMGPDRTRGAADELIESVRGFVSGAAFRNAGGRQ